jgi:hypothetical protein
MDDEATRLRLKVDEEDAVAKSTAEEEEDDESKVRAALAVCDGVAKPSALSMRLAKMNKSYRRNMNSQENIVLTIHESARNRVKTKLHIFNKQIQHTTKTLTPQKSH